MKRRIRKTGEIVDVIDWFNFYRTDRCEDDTVSYIDSKGVEHHKKKGLNLWWDFEDVEDVPHTSIDWEQIRINTAISALQGYLSNTITARTSDKELAEWSVKTADALIAELKKGGEK